MHQVTHCICHDRAIADIVAEARAKGLATIAQIQDALYCANRCGLCVPYIEEELSESSSSG